MNRKITHSNLIAIILVATMFAWSGCKKYEEGPVFSLRSKKDRVVGKWKVEKYLENGTDQTSSLTSLNFRIEFKKDGKAVQSFSSPTFGTISEEFKWEFDDNKEKLIFIFNSGEKEEFKILRLKHKELWLRQSNGTDVQEIHLVAE
jgi:hypothetical protein